MSEALKLESKRDSIKNLPILLKDTDYKLTQFSEELIDRFEKRIFTKEVKGKSTLYTKCLIRDKEIKLTPEEVVRQLYIMVLTEGLGYPKDRIELEYAVSFGREKKRADIIIFDKDKTTVPYIMVEVKKPKLKDGKEQLKSYCNATGAPIGVWSNGGQISYYHRKDPNYFEDIPAIPSATQKLSDIIEERWFIDDLIAKDKLATERKSLKDLILEMEDEVLANAGVDVFEEMFKLIFSKLYDELKSGRDKSRFLHFRNYGDTETELKDKIQEIFDQAPSMKFESYYGGSIRFIKTDNLRENQITNDFSHHLSLEGNDVIKRSALKAGDIIITIIGATYEIVGRSAVISPEHLPANINQNIALIRVKNTAINPNYLNTFLNTKFGKKYSLLSFTPD